MANLLFVDSDPVAIKAFKGLIDRSPHQLTVCEYADEAWDRLIQPPFFDLVISELKLQGGSGHTLISRIRSHPFLKRQPVLVYTKVSDREVVRQTLVLDVLNYLIKPYVDDKLFKEINRAAEINWWKTHFESNELVCRRLELSPDQLRGRRKSVLAAVNVLPREASGFLDDQTNKVKKLADNVAGLGFPDLESALRELYTASRAGNLATVEYILESLPWALHLLEEQIQPGTHQLHSQEAALDEDELPLDESTNLNLDPVATHDEAVARIDALQGYPVIESIAAAFELASDNPEIEVDTLVEMILSDPCLATQVVFFANHSKAVDREVGEPAAAIQVLGLARLRAVARSLLPMKEQSMRNRVYHWKQYWTFQIACARLSKEMVRMLSLDLDEELVYFAGLTHEIGKVLLAYLYPEGMRTAVEFAGRDGRKLREAEVRLLGMDHLEAGLLFAKRAHLPDLLQQCVQFYRDPTLAAAEHRESVALVSLADYLCRVYEVGHSGSRIPVGITSLVSHPAWTVLKPSLYHGFTIAKFERAMMDRMEILKRELVGLAAKLQM